MQLEDVMPANLHHAQEALRAVLGPEALPNVTFVSTIEEAVRNADLVIDCVPDELESKLEILWLLDRMAPPRTVFATPTTRLLIADLASCTYRPEKCIAIAAEAGGCDIVGVFEILDTFFIDGRNRRLVKRDDLLVSAADDGLELF